MSYKLTFTSNIDHIEVNGNIIYNSPYTLKLNDRIVIDSRADIIINGISYSKDTTLEIKGQDINIEQSGSGSYIEITINFQDNNKIVSTNMLSYFRDKLFEQDTWTFPRYIDFNMGNLKQSGADLTIHFPTPNQSGHSECNLATEEDSIIVDPKKVQTVYPYGDTVIRFCYIDKNSIDYEHKNFAGISLLKDQIGLMGFREVIQFDNTEGTSQISNCDDNLNYVFTFTQKQGSKTNTIKFPANVSGVVMLQESDNSTNDLIDLMFK